jgi:hypothetical protein
LNLQRTVECSAGPLDLDLSLDSTRSTLDLDIALDRPAARTRDRRVALDRLPVSDHAQ